MVTVPTTSAVPVPCSAPALLAPGPPIEIASGTLTLSTISDGAEVTPTTVVPASVVPKALACAATSVPALTVVSKA